MKNLILGICLLALTACAGPTLAAPAGNTDAKKIGAIFGADAGYRFGAVIGRK